ncbi:hypothetical protein J7K27_08050 [Candidatus Bathyarchaeota archaeon]|nr:hypothetical protein [Candidatus Bathyarchaeota archaeon]
MIEKVIMKLSPSGKAVVVRINDKEFYTSKNFVHKLLVGDIKRLKLKKK